MGLTKIDRPNAMPELPKSPAAPPHMPGISDLLGRVRFSPEEGTIHSGEVRMSLVHVDVLGNLRRELIDALGTDGARALLTRVGYTAGAIDAEQVRKVRGSSSLFDAFAVGPQLQALQGMLHSQLVRVESDPERGVSYAEGLWKNSVEADCHLSTYGQSSEPVCWMQCGYASGYTSAFAGKPCIALEVECRGMGAQACRVIAKPVDEWSKEVQDLHLLGANVLSGVDLKALSGKMLAGVKAAAVEEESNSERVVGASPSFHAACHKVRRVAGTRATVLFLGETGVGKERFAGMLHQMSARSQGPLIAVNCAAIPENLLESELFGVEKGAYTGAVASRPGRFERAHGGTLFLDEVGTLPLPAQAKLLRALQTGAVERVGDVRTRALDVRVVAATNEDLATNVASGAFRRDLFYRLNVVAIHLPPLRERREDIPLLMDHLLDRYRRLYQRRNPGFTEAAVMALLDYSFPGNVRELENMIESAVILSEDDAPLDTSALFASTPPSVRPAFRLGASGFLNPLGTGEMEDLARTIVNKGIPVESLFSRILEQALEAENGNYTRAAKRMGLTRAQLSYRLKQDRGDTSAA